MKSSTKFLALAFALVAGPASAQYVITAPLAESQSRQQVVHQGVSTTLLGRGKVLANDMKVVSGKIKGIIDQTQQLHDQWYSSLLQISGGVRTYRRVREIYTNQSEMISEFSAVIPQLRNQSLTSAQISEATTVYQGILTENVALLGELAGILSAGKAKMTDPERIEFIDNIADRILDQHHLMNYYSSKCRSIALAQGQQAQDRASVVTLMGGGR